MRAIHSATATASNTVGATNAHRSHFWPSTASHDGILTNSFAALAPPDEFPPSPLPLQSDPPPMDPLAYHTHEDDSAEEDAQGLTRAERHILGLRSPSPAENDEERRTNTAAAGYAAAAALLQEGPASVEDTDPCPSRDHTPPLVFHEGDAAASCVPQPHGKGHYPSCMERQQFTAVSCTASFSTPVVPDGRVAEEVSPLSTPTLFSTTAGAAAGDAAPGGLLEMRELRLPPADVSDGINQRTALDDMDGFPASPTPELSGRGADGLPPPPWHPTPQKGETSEDDTPRRGGEQEDIQTLSVIPPQRCPRRPPRAAPPSRASTCTSPPTFSDVRLSKQCWTISRDIHERCLTKELLGLLTGADDDDNDDDDAGDEMFMSDAEEVVEAPPNDTSGDARHSNSPPEILPPHLLHPCREQQQQQQQDVPLRRWYDTAQGLHLRILDLRHRLRAKADALQGVQFRLEQSILLGAWARHYKPEVLLTSNGNGQTNTV